MRLPSQLYLFLPILLGQVVARSLFVKLDENWTWSWENFFFAQLFGLLFQIFLILANDLADKETDTLNSTFTPFSGGSRVLVEGKLNKTNYYWALGSIFVILLLICLTQFYFFQRPWIPGFYLVSFFLIWAYSYPPFKLSYRGGGELLQTLGLGMVLPMFGYYSQAGSLVSFPYGLLTPILLVQLASAFSTTLPDEPSDRKSRKYTLSVALGGNRVQYIILTLHLAGFLVLFHLEVDVPFPPERPIWLHLPLVPWMILATLTQGRPGSKKLFWFVFFAILTNITFLITLIFCFL